jgi:hypothetical protein
VSAVGNWGCGAETLGGLFSMALGLGRLREVGGLARVAVEDASGFATTRAELAERVAGVGVTAARAISSSVGVGVGVGLGGAMAVAPAARAGDSFALERETPEGSGDVVGELSATGMGTGTIVGCDAARVPDGTSSAGFCETTARSVFA